MRKGSRPNNPIILAAALLAVLLVAGCGVPSPGTPAQIIKKATVAQGNLKSVRMEMDLTLESKGAPGVAQSGTTYMRGEGFFEQPDRSRMTIKTSTGEVDVVSVGGRLYVKQAGSDQWTEKDPAQYSVGGFSPRDVARYLKYTKGLRMVDKNGDAYHLGFDLDMQHYTQAFKVPGVDPAAFKGADAQMEVWVKKDSFYIEKVKMSFTGDLTSVGRGKVKMTTELTFSDFNKPVTIEAPI